MNKKKLSRLIFILRNDKFTLMNKRFVFQKLQYNTLCSHSYNYRTIVSATGHFSLGWNVNCGCYLQRFVLMVTLSKYSKFMHYEIGSQEQLLNFQFRLSVKFILDSFFDKNCTNTTTEIFNPMRVMKILFTNTLEALSYESYEDLIYKYRYT